MKKQMVERVVDPANLPPLSDEQTAEIAALGAMADDQIDTSDIATLPESFWRDAVPNPFYRPTKTSTTIRIDSDVLAWFKGQGKGYQTRINAILRRAMLDRSTSQRG